MKILFILDVSESIGLGHLYRCLNLCNEFELHKNNSKNIIIEFAGNNLSNIKALSKYKVHELSSFNESKLSIVWLLKTLFMYADPNFTYYDIIIIDCYDMDHNFTLHLKTIGEKIIILDDVCNRRLYADILIYQLPLMDKTYDGLVNKECIIYNGFNYVLLPNGILNYTPNIYLNRPYETMDVVEHLLINFGGSDPTNITCKILSILISNGDHTNVKTIKKISIIIGSLYNETYHNKLISLIESSDIECNIYHSITMDKMASIYNTVDLCIAGIGVSTFERAYFGLSQVIITSNGNQTLMAETLHKFDIVNYIGHQDNIKEINLLNAIKIYPSHMDNGPLFIDGYGCKRISSLLDINDINHFS